MPEGFTFDEGRPADEGLSFEDAAPETLQIGKDEPLQQMSVGEAMGLPLHYIGRGLQALANIPTEIANKVRGVSPEYGYNYVDPLDAGTSTPQIPTIPEMPGASRLLQYPAGAANALIKVAQGAIPPFAPPEVGLMAPLAGAGGVAGRIGQGLFGAPMLASVPEQAVKAYQTATSKISTPMESAEATAEPLVSLLLGSALIRNASGFLPKAQREAATALQQSVAEEAAIRALPSEAPEGEFEQARPQATIPAQFTPEQEGSVRPQLQSQAIYSPQPEGTAKIPFLKDESGKEITALHGTPDLNFSPENIEYSDWGHSGPGIYFTTDPTEAVRYANALGTMGPPGRVLKAKIISHRPYGSGVFSKADAEVMKTALENNGMTPPKVIEGKTHEWLFNRYEQGAAQEHWDQVMKEAGYDSVRIPGGDESELVVYNPKQIQWIEEPSTKGPSNALDTETAQPVRALRDESIQSPSEVPTEGAGPKDDGRGNQGEAAGAAAGEVQAPEAGQARPLLVSSRQHGNSIRLEFDASAGHITADQIKQMFEAPDRSVEVIAFEPNEFSTAQGRANFEVIVGTPEGPYSTPLAKKAYHEAFGTDQPITGKSALEQRMPFQERFSRAIRSAQERETGVRPNPVLPTQELSGGLGGLSPKRGRDIRERFSEFEREDSPEVAKEGIAVVQAGPRARGIVDRFLGTTLKGNVKALADFVRLGLDNRRIELNSRGLPAAGLPALTPAEAAAIRADPLVQKGIKYWNENIKPTIEDIRTRNGMIMSPNWNKMDLMLNLPVEQAPDIQRRTNLNLNEVYNKPASGENAVETDPAQLLDRVLSGHFRYDASNRLMDAIKALPNIPDPKGVTPGTFPRKGSRAQEFKSMYKGHETEVRAIPTNPLDPVNPDYKWVPKRVAELVEKTHQPGWSPNLWDKIMSQVLTFGVMPVSFAPHVVRELAAVGARQAQAGRSAASMLPSWIGSTPSAIRRMGQLKGTNYGEFVQRLIDEAGADRGVGLGVVENQNRIMKVLNIPHDILFNHNYGIDVLARRVVADAHLRMKFGNKVIDGVEKALESGRSSVPDALTSLKSKMDPGDIIALGRRVNNTMGYGNPNVRSQWINWAQRIFPFISSESGKIPDEIRRLVTLNIDAPALKSSVAKGNYAQAAKQLAGMISNGPVGVYLLMNALNYGLTQMNTGKGKFLDENPEGRKTDIQIAPGWYWSNLDPGLSRAARITGVKEKANRPKDTPQIAREVLNEFFSVMHPGVRTMFAGLTALAGHPKTAFLDNNMQLQRGRRSDMIPFAPARQTMDSAAQGKPIVPAMIKDAAALGGVQIIGKPPNPKAIAASKLNTWVDDTAHEARQMPPSQRQNWIVKQIMTLPGSERRKAWIKLERMGLKKSYPVDPDYAQ